MTQHTGELAQLELPAALTNGGVTPGYLTLDGAVNWRAAAVYVPQLDTNIALAVKGQAPTAVAAADVNAATAAQRAVPLAEDQPILFADTVRLPNFVISQAHADGRIPAWIGTHNIRTAFVATAWPWRNLCREKS